MFEIDNKFANANVSRTVRFTDELFEELNTVADSHDISFSLLVWWIVKRSATLQQEFSNPDSKSDPPEAGQGKFSA